VTLAIMYPNASSHLRAYMESEGADPRLQPLFEKLRDIFEWDGGICPAKDCNNTSIGILFSMIMGAGHYFEFRSGLLQQLSRKSLVLAVRKARLEHLPVVMNALESVSLILKDVSGFRNMNMGIWMPDVVFTLVHLLALTGLDDSNLVEHFSSAENVDGANTYPVFLDLCDGKPVEIIKAGGGDGKLEEEHDIERMPQDDQGYHTDKTVNEEAQLSAIDDDDGGGTMGMSEGDEDEVRAPLVQPDSGGGKAVDSGKQAATSAGAAAIAQRKHAAAVPPAIKVVSKKHEAAPAIGAQESKEPIGETPEQAEERLRLEKKAQPALMKVKTLALKLGKSTLQSEFSSSKRQLEADRGEAKRQATSLMNLALNSTMDDDTLALVRQIAKHIMSAGDENVMDNCLTLGQAMNGSAHGHKAWKEATGVELTKLMCNDFWEHMQASGMEQAFSPASWGVLPDGVNQGDSWDILFQKIPHEQRTAIQRSVKAKVNAYLTQSK
jgi:hypothetical protein